MKLRKPCVHERYEEHETHGTAWPDFERCPGGVFLPDLTEALVWLEEIQDDYSTDEYGQPESFGKRRAISVILDALGEAE